MLKVGLTGGIGCGKSTVSRLFSEKGIPVIDADEVSRALVLPGQPAFNAIVERFGDEVTSEQGLDRGWLRQRIFNHAEDRLWLESLLHPMVFERMQSLMNSLDTSYCICVIPLLLESGRRCFVDRLLVVDCDPEIQRRRVADRDGMAAQDIERMMAAQVSREVRLRAADDVISNSGNDMDGLAEQVDRLDALYQRLGCGLAA